MSYFKSIKLIDTNNNPQGLLMEAGSITARDYFVAVAEGDIANHKHWDKLGFNPDVDNVEEDVMGQGGVYIFPALTGIQMDIVSTSANDDGSPLGTGVRTVIIHYLDSTGADMDEIITMNGVTAVPTVATNISRVNYLTVKTCGTGGSAAGVITLSEHAGTTRIYAQIAVGNTRSRQCVYTVPLGNTLFINSMVVSGVNTSATHWARFTLKATYDEIGEEVTDFFLPFAEVLVMDATFQRDFITPLKFIAGTDIKITAISDAASSNEVCACSLRGWLET